MRDRVTERELAKNAARRLEIIRHAEEVTGSVVKTCRYHGISRQIYYTGFTDMKKRGLMA